MSSDDLERDLVMEFVRVTEKAALSCYSEIGRGDEKAADAAAVKGMREALNVLPIDGVVVIGEGERDEAPMLFIGEEVGSGGQGVDLAMDPLEGTTICAKNMPNSLAVIAATPKGGMLNAPDVYMDKIAVGGGLPDGVIDLDKSPTENAMAVAAAKGKDVKDVCVCVLDRPRHAELIKELRGIGCPIKLIGDGDVAGVIATTKASTMVDMYIGSGGAPEGVLAAAALRCIGGQFQGRLVFRNDDERARAKKWGITDLNRKYCLEELVSKEVIFVATGVTDGDMVEGVHKTATGFTTETLALRSSSKTVRYVKGHHVA